MRIEHKCNAENKYKIVLHLCFTLKTKNPLNFLFYRLLRGSDLWSHLGSNQGPPDYESGALTN